MKLKLAVILFALMLPATGVAQEVPQSGEESSPTPKEVPINPAVAERVDVMLSGIEFEPTKTQWIALGADAPRVLVKVAADESLQVVKRSRAIVALAHFEHAPSSTVLEDILADEKTPEILIRKSIWALSRISPETAVALIQPHLEHPKLAVREEAVEALGLIASKPAVDALQGRLKSEKSAYLKKKIQSAIASTGETR